MLKDITGQTIKKARVLKKMLRYNVGQEVECREFDDDHIMYDYSAGKGKWVSVKRLIDEGKLEWVEGGSK